MALLMMTMMAMMVTVTMMMMAVMVMVTMMMMMMMAVVYEVTDWLARFVTLARCNLLTANPTILPD